MDSILEYLNMDGDAKFVWPALAIAAVILVGMLAWSMYFLTASRRRLDKLEAAGIRPRRRAAKSGSGSGQPSPGQPGPARDGVGAKAGRS